MSIAPSSTTAAGHLQHGEAHIDLNTMAPLPLPDDEPHVLFSPRQDVVIWPLAELNH